MLTLVVLCTANTVFILMFKDDVKPTVPWFVGVALWDLFWLQRFHKL